MKPFAFRCKGIFFVNEKLKYCPYCHWEICESGGRGISIGFTFTDPMLDVILGNGFEGGKLYLIAGRPGIGKTTFAHEISYHIAKEEHKSVYYQSLESYAAQCIDKLIKCAEKDFGGNRNQAIELVKNCDITIDDNSITDLEMLPDTADIMIFDYIQLMTLQQIANVNSRFQELEKILYQLKQIARERNIPVVVLAQLGREVEWREDHRPVLSDIRSVACAEEISDVVMFLYRENYYYKDDVSERMEVIVAKNRGGVLGTYEF